MQRQAEDCPGSGLSNNPFVACESFENSIVATTQAGMQVGKPYYMAVWDPAGKARDYTMNLGVTDAHYVDRLDINAEIECFKLIHGGCSQPYPGESMPEGYFSSLFSSAADTGFESPQDAGVEGSADASTDSASKMSSEDLSSGCSVSSPSSSAAPHRG